MRSRSSYQKGKFAELYARFYLRLHGFRILHSRYITGRHTNRAEIDIIARRGKLLVFIEVKNRPTSTQALTSVSVRQSSRLRCAAETYISRSGWMYDARFDIIAICGLRIYWIKNFI